MLNITWDYQGWFAELSQRRGGLGMTARAKRVLLTESNRRTVKFWIRVFIPKHYERGGHSRYGYQARKEPYKRIKVLLANEGEFFNARTQQIESETVIKGGVVSMVRSGRAEQTARHTVPPIVASPSQAIGKVIVPRYVTIRRTSSQPNQKHELQRITSAERGGLRQVWAKQFYRGVRQLGSAGYRVRRKTP